MKYYELVIVFHQRLDEDALKKEQENQLRFAVQTRRQTVDQLLGRLKGIAEQITSRTKAREMLERYNAGQADLDAGPDEALTELPWWPMNRRCAARGARRFAARHWPGS